MDFQVAPASGRMEREHCLDLRRTVLCGELHWERAAAEELQRPGLLVLLASLGAKPVGTARIWSGEAGWVLDGLAVLPAFRGRGLGKILLRELEAHAGSQGATSVAVAAPLSGADYFKKLGFSELRAAGNGLVGLEKKLA